MATKGSEVPEKETPSTSAFRSRKEDLRQRQRSSLPRRFRALEKVSKASPVWYNFNSRQMTVSISNFNKLKSPLRRRSGDWPRRFSSLFPGAERNRVQRINPGIFAERNGHKRD